MKTLITCHANADCDAFAAMLAARRLYPDADLLFPGTQEAGLAKVYAELDKQKYNFIDQDRLNQGAYARIVLVDTRQTSRAPAIAPLLGRANMRLEIWDHHPAASDDIANAVVHYASCGAVTSLLCSELEKKKIQLDPEEATLLGLGIYADTGCFTYTSTTQADFQAAAWLLAQGMDVNRINDLTSREMTALHVQALNSLLESAQTYTFNGVPVVLAEASMEHYLGDFANLAHKMMDMENIQALFALGLMGDRIQIVARSHSKSINVAEICAQLGGGGHAYAASASLRCQSLQEVRDTILRCLHAQTHPDRTVADYMSQPAIGISSTGSMREADELMLHFGLKAIPVFAPGTRTCVGLLDAQTAARAAAHGLGSELVQEYMQRRVTTLAPGASLRELAQIIVSARQRLVPIVENDQVAGVVTRTDLINILARESTGIAPLPAPSEKNQNVAKLLRDKLPAETGRLLKLAGELGKKMRLPVYAVGGFVRDLLIGHTNLDIDLVAEGNGIAFARELAKELGGRVREHQKFLTSIVIYHDAAGVERHIDVATARLEYYEYPAALPTVELSSIKMDLFRRDFSINSLAVRLDGEFYGELQDFFGGRRDIKDKLIRVLHTLSFVEDPTRCIRAVRFEQRYKFRLGPGTEKLLRNILPMHLLEKLSADRLFHEIRLLCNEENAAACLERLESLGILKALCPGLTLLKPKRELLQRIQEIMAWYRRLYFEEEAQNWICYFLGLAQSLAFAEASEIYDRLGLPRARKHDVMLQREKLRAAKGKLVAWQTGSERGAARVSQLCGLLRDFSIETLLFAMALFENPGLEKNISLYLTQWRREKADINGNDLKAIGVKPGPLYGELLRMALNAKLDGHAPTGRAQLRLVTEHLKKMRDSA
ncbi:MAG: CBS domain-containing protein [Desulfovibrio sp.]|nr:CBS domain-containing protein [Desulfovibrio sp.]